MLGQPLDQQLTQVNRVLLAGCGGGYDLFGAVPLAVELLARGQEVFLANLSFCYLNGLDGARQHPTIPTLYEVPSDAATEKAYCPEAWLARWFEERMGLRQPIWAFDRNGVQPLHAAYRHLVESLEIEGIVLVDGGIDGLLRGDESSLGTPAEDLTSIAAVHGLDLPGIQLKVLTCFALGAEIRDGICHEQVLRRIAELARAGGHLGVEALLPSSEAGRQYLDAVEYTFSHQQDQRRSHINWIVSEAMRGSFGSQGPQIWISPLLSLFWFFDLDAVARSHLFLSELWETQSILEVTARIEGLRREIEIRERSSIPI